MLKDAVQIRLLPELNFIIDDSVDYSIKIDGILARIKREESERAAQNSNNTELDAQKDAE